MNTNNEDKGFLLQLHMRAERKAKEYADLLHERQRIEMKIERTREYIDKLNSFLKAEGEKPASIKATPHLGSVVGKPGNRSKAFPVRRIKWEGMSINQIVESILNASPATSFHPKDIASEIYEIESDSDLQIVMRNMRSAMQRGAREGRWVRTGRAQFKAKVTEKQGEFVKN